MSTRRDKKGRDAEGVRVLPNFSAGCSVLLDIQKSCLDFDLSATSPACS